MAAKSTADSDADEIRDVIYQLTCILHRLAPQLGIARESVLNSIDSLTRFHTHLAVMISLYCWRFGCYYWAAHGELL